MKSQRTYNINTNLGYLLSRSAQQYRAEVTKALQPCDLTATQFFILMSIWYQGRHLEPPTQVQVAEYAATDVNVTSQVIRKLIARKLIERTTSLKDSRAYVLSVTPDGEALAQKSGQLIEALHTEFFGSVNQQSLATELKQLVQ